MLTSLALQSTAETNRVLRNVFALLALTLLPTVGGVFLGIELGLPQLMAESPWLSLGGFLLIAIPLMFAIYATAQSALSIPILFLFTAFMGANLSGIISVALGVANGSSLISMAALGTAGIMAGCSMYAMTTKRDFSSMGGFLFGALIGLVVLGFSNIFFQAGWLALVLAAVALVLFSMFMIHDVQKIVSGGETNYVIATVSIYLNMINIFSSLLQLLLAFGGDD